MKPKKLKIEIGGYFSGTSKVVWEDDILRYYMGYSITIPNGPLDIDTTETKWMKFWDKMEQLNVWNWKEFHYAPVLDGTHWSVEIVVGDKSIKSQGSNSYPSKDGRLSGEPCHQTKLFKDFLKAVSRLIGKKFPVVES